MLTAYNEDVQRYLEAPSKKNKNKIIQELKENALAKGINFNKLFPKGTKRYQVLDNIIYMLSNGGVCKVSSSNLANMTGVSVRTVYTAVADIKKLDMFIVGGLADGKNKYIFVYKGHEDFTDILNNVFYLNTEQIAEQVAEQENPKPLENKDIEGDKGSSIYSIYSISKQEKDIIKQSIENEIKNAENTKQKAKEYLISKHQKELYEMITNDSKLHHDIRKNSLILTLRAGSNIDEKLCNKAMVSIRKIDKYLKLGGKIENSITALFEKIYKDRIKYNDYYTYKVLEEKPKRDVSVYYNWLENE